VLSEKQFARLARLADEQAKPVSVLIREAVERTYFEQAQHEQRRTALATLLSLDAPTSDWEQMEEEIIRGALQ
jgi:hypothetical protein